MNTKKIPQCPACGKKLKKEVSLFAVTGKAKEPGSEMDDLPFDESKMENAMASLAMDAENINEEDPRQAAQLMRKLSDMTGMELGDNMQEAIARMEAGEDPEAIEKEMGDLMESEDPFKLPEKGGNTGKKCVKVRGAPKRDPGLYDFS